MIVRTVIFAGSIALFGLAVTTHVSTDPAPSSFSSPADSLREALPPWVEAVPADPRLLPASSRREYTPLPISPPSAQFSESTVWLARAIYSETKRPHEQELVAWVVRNRVETAYRGESTYKGVVLDPYQFSAFNPGAPRRAFLMSLTPEMHIPRWRQSLWIAYYVRHADPRHRPFSIETRHFFSEISMRDRMSPYWANIHRLVPPGFDYEVKEDRFRFYDRIS